MRERKVSSVAPKNDRVYAINRKGQASPMSNEDARDAHHRQVPKVNVPSSMGHGDDPGSDHQVEGSVRKKADNMENRHEQGT